MRRAFFVNRNCLFRPLLILTFDPIMKNDLLDLDKWVQEAVDGKNNNCWKRFQREWTTRLMEDASFTDSIPSNQADFVALVIARADYKNRKARDDERDI